MVNLSVKEIENLFGKTARRERESDVAEGLEKISPELRTKMLKAYEINPPAGWMSPEDVEDEIIGALVAGLIFGIHSAHSRAGSVKSPAKARASRRNGKLGGRPKKESR